MKTENRYCRTKLNINQDDFMIQRLLENKNMIVEKDYDICCAQILFGYFYFYIHKYLEIYTCM